jgi:glycosyltransferase involved in cell wall biosynthesis
MESMKTIKIIRATTVPMSLNAFCKGMLRELSERYEVVALSSSGEDLDIVGEREGVRTIAVPMERHISLLKDFKALVKMIGVFRRERPTMVHSMTPKAGLICMMAGWLTGVPVRLHTFTGLVWPTSTGLKRKILMLTDRITCGCATHIIPEGEGVKHDLIAGKITKKPLKVLGYGNVMGVDMNRFRISDELTAQSKKLRTPNVFTFLYVGRVVREKGINELCQAFDKLSGMAPVRLLLVGPYEDSLDPISEQSREIIKNNPSIESVGAKYGEDLLTYYAASDCFVFPSYREGFPNTVMEAGAMGLACIVTDINGSREIIRDGENGVIVPSKDADALFDAMLMMVRDKEKRERMAGNAREMITDRFEQGFVRKCLYDYYDEILRDKS